MTCETPLFQQRQGDPLSPFLFLIAAEGLNVMMNALGEAGHFSGYKVGAINNLVSITHLQFADDTLLIGDRSWANIRALKAILILFEATSGLKVNFHKSVLVGVNIQDSWLAEAASIFNCFFWGGCEEVRKISWINWDTICSKKEDGGLGVRRIWHYLVNCVGVCGLKIGVCGIEF